MKYILLAILFLTNAGLYLWFSPAYKDLYEYQFRAWYFGSEGLFMSLFLFLMSPNLKWWYQRLIIRCIGLYEGARAIMYILNYTMIWTEEARFRMWCLSIVILIFIVLFVKNCYKLGFTHRQ